LRLIEYNNHEGFVLASSMTNKRVKNVRQYLKMGQDDFMNVYTVDKKGNGGHAFIDLTKKNV
jgi:translation initiation factor 2 alpha subunit (eIF-2alpha)